MPDRVHSEHLYRSAEPKTRSGNEHEDGFEIDIQRRVFLTALEPGLAKKLTECARKQGVSTETLINVWLTEKVTETSQGT